MRLTCCPRPCQAGPWVTPSCGSGRTREKVLEGWKVYVGTNNLHQLPEAASIAQIIINGNYTDEQDDYDIALMRLAKPLALSGEWVGAWHTHVGSSRQPSGPRPCPWQPLSTCLGVPSFSVGESGAEIT